MELTKKERLVLSCLAEGLRYKQIAYKHKIKERGIQEITNRLKVKMNASTLFELGIRYSECLN